jgi:hypothetical protein
MLSCWRVAHLVAREDGPFDVVLRARARAGDSTVGRLMDCPYCVSVWAAVPVAAWLVRRRDWDAADALALWLGVSGGACVLERVTARDQPPAAKADEVVEVADFAKPLQLLTFARGA